MLNSIQQTQPIFQHVQHIHHRNSLDWFQALFETWKIEFWQQARNIKRGGKKKEKYDLA